MTDTSNHQILVVVNTEYTSLSKVFDEYEQDNIERCPECGSSLFRIYKQPVPEGSYDQMVCVVCDHRYGGYLNRYKEKPCIE